MSKKYVVIIVAVVLVVAGLVLGVKLRPVKATEVTITFNEDGGFKLRSAHVYIANYDKGKRAEAVYRIINNTSGNITAEFGKLFAVNPEADTKLEGKGYVAVPAYYSDWVDIPKPGSIEPHQEVVYNVILKIPADTSEVIPAKWAFQLTTASGIGGFTQVAPGVWWVIDMR